MIKRTELCFGEFDSKVRDFIHAEEYYYPVDLRKFSKVEKDCLCGAAILDVSNSTGFCSMLDWGRAYAIFLQLGLNFPGDWYSGPRNMANWFKTWNGKNTDLVKALGALAGDKNLHFSIIQELLDMGIIKQDDIEYPID